VTFAVQNAWRDRFTAVPFEDRDGKGQGGYFDPLQHQAAGIPELCSLALCDAGGRGAGPGQADADALAQVS